MNVCHKQKKTGRKETEGEQKNLITESTVVYHIRIVDRAPDVITQKVFLFISYNVICNIKIYEIKENNKNLNKKEEILYVFPFNIFAVVF